MRHFNVLKFFLSMLFISVFLEKEAIETFCALLIRRLVKVILPSLSTCLYISVPAIACDKELDSINTINNVLIFIFLMGKI